ncbi:hypothetical protein A9Q78_02185 [Methylophaga sp. 41_12_T18]|nr:hypothetical protein A9Q78_02185 [Methylophaga sp. 41_12_T18]
MTNLDYSQLFQSRGHKYQAAMQRYPNARDQEFKQAINKVHFNSETTIVDVPARGAYLQRYLPDSCIYRPYEPCTNFLNADQSPVNPLLPLPFEDDSADIVFSIAGMHHQADKKAVYRELYRIMAKSSQLVVADVHQDSSVANFLDLFVGNHNSTGHQGLYLNSNSLPELSSAGFQIQSAERIACPWQFNNTQEMANFCRSLFDLQSITASKIISAIECSLGITSEHNKVSMNWELFYIVANKQSK